MRRRRRPRCGRAWSPTGTAWSTRARRALSIGDDAPATADTMFRIASMTKALTSVAALQLIEQGRLAARPDGRLGAPRRSERCSCSKASTATSRGCASSRASRPSSTCSRTRPGWRTGSRNTDLLPLARGHRRARPVHRPAQVPRHAVRRRAGRALGVRRQHRLARAGGRGCRGPAARLLPGRTRL